MKKSSKSKRIENIDPELDTLAKELQYIARKALAEYTPIVNSIVNSKSRDTRHIEQVLDGLLGFCFDVQALQLYKKAVPLLLPYRQGCCGLLCQRLP